MIGSTETDGEPYVLGRIGGHRGADGSRVYGRDSRERSPVSVPAELGKSVELAAALFGLGSLVQPPRPVSQAWSNDVFRVHAAAGEFAIKLFPVTMPAARHRQLHAGMDFEASVLTAGVIPIPRPVSSKIDSGAWTVELPGTSRLARCHRWVEGRQPEGPLSSDHVRAAGGYLGSLHAMDRAGGDTSRLPRLDRARWEAAVHAAANLRLSWAEQLAELTPLVERLGADLDELRDQRRPMWISHRDFDPKNTVVDPAGRLIITDWDYAGPVLPGAELIIGATSFAESDDGVRDFVEAYREAGGHARAADRLSLAAEAAYVDWLLRNVEACVNVDLDRGHDHHRTAADLIASFAADVETLYAWPDRLAAMGL